ncbi:DUF3379 domain-containing protein [Lacimicrobium alkaliphilum]|uniref:DUF3379 domain-containing protein n=1 Tax=Lacimicrobium alkaliphilum TaxID=1526571 RepID=A0ABQ1R4N0_9ALTE|nr:DUF3379 domain-containing protein [Lacimicrobium alkaliphilum]GGD55866.1 hypothetical protein GCM10011357_09340 [Lacimicrobium alkaliphilum]
MDDLEFRRTIYADPYCDRDDVKQAAGNDPAKQQFWDEMKRLDKALKNTAKVPVPDGLAQRVLLKQSMQAHKQQQVKRRWHLSIAASVIFMLGVSFTLWQQQDVDLSKHALAHVYHDAGALQVDENVPLEQVNAKLASFGGQFTDDIGKVYYANFCDFNRVKSLHMVIEGEHGKVTVFVVPHKDNQKLQQQFNDERYQGRGMALQQASLIMVGANQQSLQKIQNKLQSRLLFAA